MGITLSQIRAWSTEPLTAAASQWSKTADQWEDAFSTMRDQSYAMAWHGAGGDGLRQRTSADLATVNGAAERLRQAAAIARKGASDISAAKRRALYAVEDAQNAGYDVGEDLSVSYTDVGGSAAEQAARQAQAERIARSIWSRAKQLEGADRSIANQVTATAGDVGQGGFARPNGHSVSTIGDGGSPRGGRNGHITPAVVHGQRGGIQLVDVNGGAEPAPPMPQPTPASGQPQIGPFPVPPLVAAAAPKTPPPPTALPVPAPRPPAPAGPSFGQCVGQQVKTNIGKDMVKSGFTGGIAGAISGIIGGAAGGAAITPELAGAGALPGAVGGGVLGFVGGFTKGLLKAPVKSGIRGAIECAN
ncbi:hypothetical protein [Mycobacterium asiaticum]|uniref:PPE family domain-containing protein n=1 Tax=Mycobacterium asiaticum TaxID=1790 RepID=A0A1A3MSY3_MYCAS|nr:hypothetical protein [Mycobacterium asiaticum]OBK12636.1 hypothetical protein A5636_11575 [Mycobacterium asiaticum]